MNSLRLGNINFVNCLPLTYGLNRAGMAPQIDVKMGTPAQLNSMVTSGMLDVSPVSSIIYARNAADLLVLPDVSISADGALQSILLVTKRNIKDLNNARIALTRKSATTHCLLKIILSHAYNIKPEYYTSDLSLEAGVLDEADAALFIGDDALYAYHNRVTGLNYYDLGEEWKKLTGLSMVYAVWVVNRDFAATNKELVQLAYDTVIKGFQYGLKNISEAADTIVGRLPFNTQQIIRYIGLLNYRFTSQHEQALLTFYRLANEIGLLAEVPDIEYAEVRRWQGF